MFIFQFLNDEMQNYVKQNKIVHFVIQKLKNKHTFVKNMQTEKAKKPLILTEWEKTKTHLRLACCWLIEVRNIGFTKLKLASSWKICFHFVPFLNALIFWICYSVISVEYLQMNLHSWSKYLHWLVDYLNLQVGLRIP